MKISAVALTIVAQTLVVIGMILGFFQGIAAFKGEPYSFTFIWMIVGGLVLFGVNLVLFMRGFIKRRDQVFGRR